MIRPRKMVAIGDKTVVFFDMLPALKDGDSVP